MIRPALLFNRKSTAQLRNISDKKTTTTKTYLSVIFWLVCFPLMAQVPTITSFSPSNGPIGTSVTISGSNFDLTPANNTVFFGATEATVTAAAADQLIVDVPLGATYAPITVMVNGLTGYSSSPFIVTFTSPVISNTSYAPFEEYDTGSSPKMVASGDLDGDGKPDLAVVNGSSYTVSIYRNTSTSGAISYEPKIDFTTGTNPNSVAIGDLDGDGLLDLVVANQNDHSLSVFKNTSTGSTINFNNKVDFTTGTSPLSVALGDLDGDGKVDLIAANSGDDNFSVLRNTSTNGVIDATSFASKIDFATGLRPYALAIGDLDGDKKVDVVVVNRNSNTLSTYLNISTSGVIDASSFAAKVDQVTGLRPYAVALGDLDNDGKADLAVPNNSQQTTSVFKNSSTGQGVISYSRTDFIGASSPTAVAIGDLDGDGKPDLVVAGFIGRVVSLLKNTSTGGTIDASSFADKVDIASGYYQTMIALSDQDGDHKPEILTNNQIDNAISIIRHTGSDTNTDFTEFSLTEQTEAAQINTIAHTIGIVVEYGTDLTALIATFELSPGGSTKVGSTAQASGTTSNDFTNPVVYSVMAGDGATTQDWTVTVTTEPPSTETDITAFSLAEQTNSATIDATAHTVEIEVFSGTDLTALVTTFTLSAAVTTAEVGATAQISGTTPNDFTNPVTYTVTAEDGTTSQDWVITVSVAAPVVAINSFVPTSGPVGTSVVITGTSFDPTPANNVVFFGAVQATVTAAATTELTVTVPTGATYRPIAVLVNGLIAQSSTPFEVTFNSAAINAHSFASKVDFASGTSPSCVNIGDLDHDGKPDLAITNGNGLDVSASIFKNTSLSGNISFAASVDLATGASQQSVAVGDIDGDGKLDLAMVTFSTNTVSIFRNISVSGTLDETSFAVKVDFETGASPRSVAVGDLDGDGKLDLAVANRNSNTVSVFENTSSVGIISFATKVDFATGSTPYSVSINDLDDDGKPEIVVSNRTNNTVSVLKNTSTIGTINYDPKVDFDTGTEPEMAVIGDLDGDDKPDLAVVNHNSNTVSVLMNTSSSGVIDITSFTSKVDFETGAGPRSLVIGDLDGNGKQDIVVTNDDDNSVSVFMNTSNVGAIDVTSFAAKVDFETGTGPQSLAIGDLDGDGKSDLVVGNNFSASLFRHALSDTEFLAFSLPDQTGEAIIDEVNHTITIEVPYTPDVSALIPSFMLSAGATVAVNGTTQESDITAIDFSNPVTYTVMAEDNTTTQDWVVTVNLAPNTATDITEFSIPNQLGDAIIDATAYTVDLEVPIGTDVTSLVPTFTLSYGAKATVHKKFQTSGATANDFTDPVTYTVIAEEGGAIVQNWTVTVTLVLNTATDFTAFSLPQQTRAATIDETNHSIVVEVPFGTDVSALVAVFSLSSGATAKVNGNMQTSGTSSNNFTNSVTYSVTAQDGTTTQDWQVSVTAKANGMPTVSAASFSIDEDVAVGALVGQVSASDPDGDDLMYTIQSGNDGNVFKIDQNTGNISVASSLDFETIAQYSLVIEVNDSNGGTSTAMITVSLNDVTESVLTIENEVKLAEVYPNPVSNLLKIRWSHFDQAILREFSGREVLKSSLREVDLSNLPTGIYILTLEGKSNEQVNLRVVKE